MILTEIVHLNEYLICIDVSLITYLILSLLLLQSNEVKSSYHMELEGLKRMFRTIESKGLTIHKLVTDRHRQLAKHIRETTPNVIHLFDVWHVAKGGY